MRRLLGAYRLPLTGIPPGPVTLAASEPCRENKSDPSSGEEKTKKKTPLTFAASITSNSTSSPSPTLRRNFLGLFLFMAVYGETIKMGLPLSHINSRKCPLPYLMNKHVFFGIIPVKSHFKITKGNLGPIKALREPKIKIQWTYLFMNPYPFRTLNHFTVP